MTLLALGVLQPASAAEVLGFLKTVFIDSGETPSLDDFRNFLNEQCRSGRVIRVIDQSDPYYSLTLLGSYHMPSEIRKSRDKFRAYLLRDSHRLRFIESRGVEELAGVAPAVDASSGVKGRAPNKLVRPATGLRFAHGRAYWPRIQGQFVQKTGPNRQPRDAFPPLLSFISREQAHAALPKDFSFDYVGLSVCVGVSAQLIWNITRATHKHYRRFEVPKKGGGVRVIESPKVFLKVIQWFIADFVLPDLRVHSSVHSFKAQHSISTNAKPHERQKYVGNIDVKDFFGSITTDRVIHCLRENGFDQLEAVVLAKLCTHNDVLPQGAPTSPILSNSILFQLDTDASEHCSSQGLTYSRYADDITISGSDRNKIKVAFRHISSHLEKLGLKLNTGKTRIASQSSQQRVTGVVVNSISAPPRTYRRRARAMFHGASKAARLDKDRVAELGGVLGFLKIFPMLAKSREIERYEAILRNVRASSEA